jgi:Ca2+-binding EF-hand superfamily protein
MSTAAIIAARHNRKKAAGVGSKSVTAERIQAKKDALQRRAEIQELFLKYDKSGSGSLSEDEVRTMLTDLDNSTPAGTPPSDEELKFIMKVADWSETNTISKAEVSYVVSAWTILTAKRQNMETVLKEFDTSGDGKLSKEELAAYLTKLNGGLEVAPEEVEWVMSQADVFGDNAIRGPEIVMASAAWFAHVEEMDDAKGMPAPSAESRGRMLVAEEDKIRQTFRKWDCSNTGTISVEDLSSILAKTGVTPKQIEVLFRAMDANQDGKVAYEEFIQYIFSENAPASSK